MNNKRFLLNTNSKRIHDLQHITGNCRIAKMREEYMQYFETLEDALQYPAKESPLAKPCYFCLRDYEKMQDSCETVSDEGSSQ